MNGIIEYTENIIDTLRNDPAFRLYTFVWTYPVRDYDPVHIELFAVFNIDEIKTRDGLISRLYSRNMYGDVYKAKLTVRLYGGNTITGDSLSLSSVKLYKAVLAADSGELITDSCITPIQYENGTGAVYRELVFNLEYVLCGAVE